MSWECLNRKGYAEMMRALAAHQLKQREIITYLGLVTFVDADGYAYPGIDAIARAGGIPRRSVLRALPELESRGLVQIKHGRGRAVNRYRVIHPLNCSANLAPQEDALWCQSDRLWCQSVTRSSANMAPERLPENVTRTPPDEGEDYIPFDQVPEDV